MHAPLTRRSVLALTAGLIAGTLSGCQQSSEIPLVEFPKDLPPPPPPPKDAGKVPPGSAISQGVPPT